MSALDDTRHASGRAPTVAIVVRSDDPGRCVERLHPIVDALGDCAVRGRLVWFDDDNPEALRKDVQHAAGVLVWADPVTDRGTRSALDAQLRAIAATGTWVSAHPGVVDTIGTKDVIVTTAQLSWGTDAHSYPTFTEFTDRFPVRLAEAGTRVLKADRGNGGRTVWKVTLLGHATASGGPVADHAAAVMVQHARHRDDTHILTTLGEFMSSCAPIYATWGGTGHLIDQPYQPRVSEGLVRCYLVQNAVVGFGLQNAPARDAGVTPDVPAPSVLGVPSPKTMVPPDHPPFRRLRDRVESEWVPAVCAVLATDRVDLPMLWDVDLIRGTPSSSDPDPYVLCEINASSVLPYPPETPAAVARAVRERLR